MGTYQLIYKPYGNAAVLIEWPKQISEEILNDIRHYVAKIKNKNIKGIVELNYVYSTLLVCYDFKYINFLKLKNMLKSIYTSVVAQHKLSTYVWLIPVCYDVHFGIDLPLLASEKNCSLEEIISLHSSTDYTVYGIGFLPGFLYLGGLPEKLHFPRRNTPRLAVPKGAVAIGGNQTGIYPQSSPGGWNIIGNTPVTLFDVSKETPCMISPGDKIRFQAISKTAFEIVVKAREAGNYELKRY